MTGIYKHQSACDPGCYPSSCGGYGRVRHVSSGSCSGGSQGIRYVPTCRPYYGIGSGYECGSQGRSIRYYPVGYGQTYGNVSCGPQNYGCYPLGYGQGSLSGCYGGIRNSGCYGFGYNSGCNYGQGYSGHCYSSSLPCYNNPYRRCSIPYNQCGPCQ